MKLIKPLSAILLGSVLVGGMAGCSDSGGSDDPVVTPTPDPEPTPEPTPEPEPTTAQLEVRIINLTQAQPLSPVAVIVHNSGYNAFIDGETASTALETLAEGGDNSALIAEAEAAEQYLAHASTEGPVGPNISSDALTLTIEESELESLNLTVVTMLVNTNDAFTALNAVDISNLTVGQSRTFNAPTWDSGTEANSEASGTIPGPADTSEDKVGFDEVRDDILDLVRFHQGVVTNADGLETSILGEIHRFDNPTSRVVITRVN